MLSLKTQPLALCVAGGRDILADKPVDVVRANEPWFARLTLIDAFEREITHVELLACLQADWKHAG